MADLLPQPRPPLLVVRFRPSIRLAAMLSFAHASATGLLWPLILPAAAKLAGSAILAASLVFYLKRNALLRSPDSVIGLELSHKMACTLETQNGERIMCAVLGSSFVAPYLTVLELQPLKLDAYAGSPANQKPWRKCFSRSVVILPDGVDPEEFRQLRVLLRWKWKDSEDSTSGKKNQSG
jgi:toxin CptA